MKALFITTQTNDTHNLVDAWDLVNPSIAHRVMFNYLGYPSDNRIIRAAQKTNPEVIFYIGGCMGSGLPSYETFRQLRSIAPLVNLIPDAADPPWHVTIDKYREEECFDLHVGVDGCPWSPVDHVTVTPVPYNAFQNHNKDIKLGFSGGQGGKRNKILKMIGVRCEIRVRNAIYGKYSEHASFLSRCHMILNTSWTGSGQYYHIKGRVIEAGYAGAALLEMEGSPISHWFPENSYFLYKDGYDLIDLYWRLHHTKHKLKEEVKERASVFSQVVKERYTPMAIYKGILGALC